MSVNGRTLTGTLVLVGAALLLPRSAFAHCDGLDGPVVRAARKAVAAGDVNVALIWVQQKDEAEIRRAFEQTLKVRKLSSAAQELADTWFFETLVRVHRAGEGFPYTGLQPAGRDLGPAIPAADKAVETGVLSEVLKLLPATARDGARQRFERVTAKKAFEAGDVAAGREFVAAYVAFIHYVEEQHAGAGRSQAGCAHSAAHTQPARTGP